MVPRGLPKGKNMKSHVQGRIWDMSPSLALLSLNHKVHFPVELLEVKMEDSRRNYLETVAPQLAF